MVGLVKGGTCHFSTACQPATGCYLFLTPRLVPSPSQSAETPTHPQAWLPPLHPCTSQPLYLLRRQQQGLHRLEVLEELRLLNNMYFTVQADDFVQGTPVCKGKVTGQPRVPATAAKLTSSTLPQAGDSWAPPRTGRNWAALELAPG